MIQAKLHITKASVLIKMFLEIFVRSLPAQLRKKRFKKREDEDTSRTREIALAVLTLHYVRRNFRII